MNEPRYCIESENNYPILDFLECDNLSMLGAKWVIDYMEKKLDGSAFDLGIKIVPLEVME